MWSNLYSGNVPLYFWPTLCLNYNSSLFPVFNMAALESWCQLLSGFYFDKWKTSQSQKKRWMVAVWGWAVRGWAVQHLTAAGEGKKKELLSSGSSELLSWLSHATSLLKVWKTRAFWITTAIFFITVTLYHLSFGTSSWGEGLEVFGVGFLWQQKS